MSNSIERRLTQLSRVQRPRDGTFVKSAIAEFLATLRNDELGEFAESPERYQQRFDDFLAVLPSSTLKAIKRYYVSYL